MVAHFRIVAVSHSANLDGAEQVFLETFGGLQARGHAVLAVLPGAGPLSQALKARKVAVEFQPLPWWILPHGQLDAGHLLAQLGPQVETLAARIRRHKADIVHSNTSVVLHGALAARLTHIPHVWQVHEMLGAADSGLDPTLGAERTWQLMARLSSPPQGRLVVAAEPMRDLARGHLAQAGLPEAAIDPLLRLLPHGHDLAAYTALPLAAAGPAGTSAASTRSGPRFVVIASITPRKGLDWLVDALVQAGLNGAKAPAYTIEVIGAAHDAAYLAELQAKIKRAGLQKRFVFAGYCHDLPARLHGARAVLHPSRNDPSPVGLILAMAAGKPVVATRCGGPQKMMIDGVSGRLVGLDEAAGFGAEVRRFIEDPAYGEEWRENARAAAVEGWGLVTYLTRLEQTYAALCKAADPSAAGGNATGANGAPAQGDGALFTAILEACHRHTGTALGDLKHLTPRQQKALTGIVKSAKLLKRALPGSIYEKLAKMF